MRVKASVKGVKEAKKNVSVLGEKVEQNLRELLLAMAFDIDGDAKQNLTDAGAVDTGRLRASIHVEKPQSSRKTYTDKLGNSYDGKLSINPKKNELLIGTNVEYAPYIHDGFRSYKGVFFLARAANVNHAKYKHEYKFLMK